MPSRGAFETPWRAAPQRHATDTCPCKATAKGFAGHLYYSHARVHRTFPTMRASQNNSNSALVSSDFTPLLSVLYHRWTRAHRFQGDAQYREEMVRRQ